MALLRTTVAMIVIAFAVLVTAESHVASTRVGSPSADASFIRVELSAPKAKCLDGSPYSYYISKGSDASKFYFNHQGGGWCQDVWECAARSKTDLGSSTTWPATMTGGDSFSRDPNTNPVMNTWNMVYLPYCDGGSFTGDATTTQPQQLYFYGLGIREAVVASLKETYGFNSATDIVVGGCSAGGLAAYLHVDWYAQQVPKARARGLPDSGFFLDGNYSRDGKPDYEGHMANLYQFMNSAAGMSTACTSKLGYKCLFALHALPYISTPVFALNSAYDATMGNGQCGHSGITFNWDIASSVNACGNYIRGLVRTLLKSPSGAFLDSCKHHCGEWGAIHIDKVTSPFAFQAWFEKGAAGAGYLDQNQTYPCSSCCQD